MGSRTERSQNNVVNSACSAVDQGEGIVSSLCSSYFSADTLTKARYNGEANIGLEASPNLLILRLNSLQCHWLGMYGWTQYEVRVISPNTDISRALEFDTPYFEYNSQFIVKYIEWDKWSQPNTNHILVILIEENFTWGKHENKIWMYNQATCVESCKYIGWP